MLLGMGQFPKGVLQMAFCRWHLSKGVFSPENAFWGVQMAFSAPKMPFSGCLLWGAIWRRFVGCHLATDRGGACVVAGGRRSAVAWGGAGRLVAEGVVATFAGLGLIARDAEQRVTSKARR